MSNNNWLKIKILIVIVLALVVSSFVSKNVFFAGTPRVNTQFIARFLDDTSHNIAMLFQKKPTLTPGQNAAVAQMKTLPVTALQPVAQGVYAKEDPGNNMIYVRITKDSSLVGTQTINVNGKIIKIYVPPKK